MTASSVAATASAIADRLAHATAIADAAGKTALAYFLTRDSLAVTQKSAAQDLVTKADKEIEAEIRTALLARFPDDGALGEEEGLVTGTSGFTWVIDPIDGTQAFLTGQPNWCISIGIRDGAGVCCGVINAPVHREVFTAIRGGGAFLNGKPISVDKAATIASNNVAFGGTNSADPAASGRFVEELYRAGGVIFRVGSGAIMLVYVASGRLAGYYDPNINDWDCAAGNLIVTEAGGIVDYRAPDMLSPGPLVAGAPQAAEEIRALVGFAPLA